MDGYFLDHGQGEIADLGEAKMRLVVPEEETGGAFSLAEFRGDEGAWTVPHIHERMEESFYVLEGTFVFTLGEREVAAKQGDFVMVPRGTPHLMRAGAGGGALLTLFTPAGLERMFMELGRLPAASITDPAVRAEISNATILCPSHDMAVWIGFRRTRMKGWRGVVNTFELVLLVCLAAERMRHRKWRPDNLHPDFAADARKGWSWRGTFWNGCEAIEEPLHPGGSEDDKNPRRVGPGVLEAMRRSPGHEDEGPRRCSVELVAQPEAEGTFEDIPGLVLPRMGVQGWAVTGSDHVLEQGHLAGGLRSARLEGQRPACRAVDRFAFARPD